MHVLYGFLTVADGFGEFGCFVTARLQGLVQIDVIFQQVLRAVGIFNVNAKNMGSHEQCQVIHM